jgi:hypothetical protein
MKRVKTTFVPRRPRSREFHSGSMVASPWRIHRAVRGSSYGFMGGSIQYGKSIVAQSCLHAAI